MTISKRRAVGAATIAALAVGTMGATASGASAATIIGAGSTFAAPIYQQWAANLKNKVNVTYQSVGSGAGIAAFAAGTANFGATDPPIGPADVATFKKGPVVSIPTAFGAITVSYKLPGIKSGLRLDGATIANIYLGHITKWNDKAIQKLNPKTKLPNTAITVVHRSDSSGTTAGFTTFLSDYSREWKSKLGANKVIQWPVGTGANGNAGVAGAVKQKTGSIGYVEQAYALKNGFTFASVKNAKGKFIVPNLASTTAAGVGLNPPANLRFVAINSPNPTAYPIVSQTFIIAYKDVCKGGMSPDQGSGFGIFLSYGLGAGQGVAKQLAYAPLPAPILTKAKRAAGSLVCNGKSIGA